MTVVVRGRTTLAGATTVGWSPAALFANGEQGAWFDPSDLGTMFQDTAGTTPVTAVGQQVARINDKSGRGNHATQATAGNRPVLQVENGRYYLEFDGATSNRWLQTSSIDFTATDKMSVFAGVRKLSDATGQLIAELGNVSAGGWYLYPGSFLTASGSVFTFLGRGAAAQNVNQAAQATGYAAPLSAALTATGNISGDSNALRVNAVLAVTATGDQGAGNYGNLPLYIGRRNGSLLPFNGRIYSLLIRGATTSALDIARTERYVANRTGVVLP